MPRQLIILSKEDIEKLSKGEPVCWTSSALWDSRVRYVIVSEEGFSNYMKKEEEEYYGKLQDLQKCDI
jgi:hypothetical protein